MHLACCTHHADSSLSCCAIGPIRLNLEEQSKGGNLFPEGYVLRLEQHFCAKGAMFLPILVQTIFLPTS